MIRRALAAAAILSASLATARDRGWLPVEEALRPAGGPAHAALVFIRTDCAFCQAADPAIASLVREDSSASLGLARVDLGSAEGASIAKRFAVESVPTIVVFDRRRDETWRFTAPPSLETLRATLRRVLTGRLSWSRAEQELGDPRASVADLAEIADALDLRGDTHRSLVAWQAVYDRSTERALRSRASFNIASHADESSKLAAWSRHVAEFPEDESGRLALGLAGLRHAPADPATRRAVVEAMAGAPTASDAVVGEAARLGRDYMAATGDVSLGDEVIELAGLWVERQPLDASSLEALVTASDLGGCTELADERRRFVEMAYVDRDSRRGKTWTPERWAGLEYFLDQTVADGHRVAQAIREAAGRRLRG